MKAYQSDFWALRALDGWMSAPQLAEKTGKSKSACLAALRRLTDLNQVSCIETTRGCPVILYRSNLLTWSRRFACRRDTMRAYHVER